MKKLTGGRKTAEVSPLGTELSYWIVDYAPWATLDNWARALAFPEPEVLKVIVQHKAVAHLAAMGKVCEAEIDGAIVYRWAVIDEALRRCDREYHAGKFDRRPTWIKWKEWMDAYDLLRFWGAELQEKALASIAKSVTVPTGEDRLAVAMANVIDVLRDQGAELQNQGVRIDNVEVRLANLPATVSRDPSEFLTARAGARENGLDESTMPWPGSSHNWEQLIGVACRKMGAVPGPKQRQRLSDGGQVREVNTWRRGDIQRAVTAIKAKAAEIERAA